MPFTIIFFGIYFWFHFENLILIFESQIKFPNDKEEASHLGDLLDSRAGKDAKCCIRYIFLFCFVNLNFGVFSKIFTYCQLKMRFHYYSVCRWRLVRMRLRIQESPWFHHQSRSIWPLENAGFRLQNRMRSSSLSRPLRSYMVCCLNWLRKWP